MHFKNPFHFKSEETEALTTGAETCAFKSWGVPELVRALFGVTGFHNSLLCLLIIVPPGRTLGQKGGGSQGSRAQQWAKSKQALGKRGSSSSAWEIKSYSVWGEGTEQGGVFPTRQGLLYTVAKGEGETSHLVATLGIPQRSGD